MSDKITTITRRYMRPAMRHTGPVEIIPNDPTHTTPHKPLFPMYCRKPSLRAMACRLRNKGIDYAYIIDCACIALNDYHAYRRAKAAHAFNVIDLRDEWYKSDWALYTVCRAAGIHTNEAMKAARIYARAIAHAAHDVDPCAIMAVSIIQY